MSTLEQSGVSLRGLRLPFFSSPERLVSVAPMSGFPESLSDFSSHIASSHIFVVPPSLSFRLLSGGETFSPLVAGGEEGNSGLGERLRFSNEKNLDFSLGGEVADVETRGVVVAVVSVVAEASLVLEKEKVNPVEGDEMRLAKDGDDLSTVEDASSSAEVSV